MWHGKCHGLSFWKWKIQWDIALQGLQLVKAVELVIQRFVLQAQASVTPTLTSPTVNVKSLITSFDNAKLNEGLTMHMFLALQFSSHILSAELQMHATQPVICVHAHAQHDKWKCRDWSSRMTINWCTATLVYSSSIRYHLWGYAERMCLCLSVRSNIAPGQNRNMTRRSVANEYEKVSRWMQLSIVSSTVEQVPTTRIAACSSTL